MFGPSLNGNTGDWSVGCSGFWFENGELAYPVAEITVAGNLIDIYGRLVPGSDLEIRGSGNLLGGEQSGHIADVGFDLYVRLVGEAVEAYRAAYRAATDGQPVTVAEEPKEVRIDLPVDAHLPHDYVAEWAELGYATTTHTAQGVTADTMHGLLTGTESRQHTYTMLTRGREANHAYLVVVGDGEVLSFVERGLL